MSLTAVPYIEHEMKDRDYPKLASSSIDNLLSDIVLVGLVIRQTRDLVINAL
jgi:hypothetical protein